MSAPNVTSSYFDATLIGIYSTVNAGSFCRTVLPRTPAVIGPYICSAYFTSAAVTGQFLICDCTAITKSRVDTPVTSCNFLANFVFMTSFVVYFSLFPFTVATNACSAL